MDEGFLEAFAHSPAPHVVLGIRLRPFSLWHEALLDSIGSPFVARTKENPLLGPRDKIFERLFLAVEVCRVLHPKLPRATGWLAQRRRRKAFRRFYRKSNRLQLITEVGRFIHYLGDYRSRPVPVSTKDSEPVKSPRWLYEISLFKRFNHDVDLAAVWNLSPGFVSWINTGALEASGARINIMTEARWRAARKTGAI